MSHFAKIENGIVTQVIVAEQDFIDSGHAGDSSLWVQTSFNANFRKNYAGIGYNYDEIRDAFIPPKPYISWVLDEQTCQWKAPVVMPLDGNYIWDENILNWVKIGLVTLTEDSK